MSLQSLERSRKRKNEDEEIMFVILPALHLYLTSQRKREIRHKSFLYGKERVRELLGGHLKNCLAAFRMEPHIFMWLASYLREQGLISDSRIKVEEKLAFFLYMLSHNASYEKLQLEFQHSGWSFSKYVREFFDIIPVLTTRIVKPLNLYETHPRIATDTRFFPYFQSFGTKFLKFKKKHFPLYDTLGDLYHRHIAEGHFNFTSTAEQPLKPDVTDIESDDDGKEMDDEGYLQILEQSEVEQVQGTQRRAELEQVQGTQRRAEVEQVQGTQRRAEVEQVHGDQRRAEVEQVHGDQRKVAGPSKIKPNKPKKSPKKSSADGLVGVMERFVKIKEKEVNHEATQNFTITKCITELRNLEGFDPAQKARAFAVFKSDENREIFLNAVDDKDGSALAWLLMEMDKLT